MADWGHQLGVRLCQSLPTGSVRECDIIYRLDLSTNEGNSPVLLLGVSDSQCQSPDTWRYGPMACGVPPPHRWYLDENIWGSALQGPGLTVMGFLVRCGPGFVLAQLAVITHPHVNEPNF